MRYLGGLFIAAAPPCSAIRQLSPGRHVVDRLWQDARELLRQVVARHAELCGELLHGIRTDRLMDLIRADGLIGPGSHPGAYGRAQSLLLELLDQTLYAAVLLDQSVDHRYHF